MLVNIATGSRKILLTPIGANDGGGILGKSKDCLQLSFHHALLLGLHVVAHGICLRLYIILLTIAEAVNNKVCL